MPIKWKTWKKYRLLEKHKLPIPNQDETENMKRLIKVMKLKLCFTKLPSNKGPGQMASQVKSIKHLVKS